jgi:hypothetical protein
VLSSALSISSDPPFLSVPACMDKHRTGHAVRKHLVENEGRCPHTGLVGTSGGYLTLVGTRNGYLALDGGPGREQGPQGSCPGRGLVVVRWIKLRSRRAGLSSCGSSLHAMGWRPARRTFSVAGVVVGLTRVVASSSRVLNGSCGSVTLVACRSNRPRTARSAPGWCHLVRWRRASKQCGPNSGSRSTSRSAWMRRTPG